MTAAEQRVSAPSLARALAAFHGGFAIPWGARRDALVQAAEVEWSGLAGAAAQKGFAADFELAWLLLEDALLAPDEPDLTGDDEGAVLVERRALFMSFAPDRDAWLDYLARFPEGDRHAGLRARRVRKARLGHGAAHPDQATLAAPPEGPIGEFVRRHLAGPQVCLACRRRTRPDEPIALAAAAHTPLCEVRLTARAADGSDQEVVVSCADDGGELRARLEPSAPWVTLRGAWQLVVHTDDARYSGALCLPEDALYGVSLGQLHRRSELAIERIELHPVDHAARG